MNETLETVLWFIFFFMQDMSGNFVINFIVFPWYSALFWQNQNFIFLSFEWNVFQEYFLGSQWNLYNGKWQRITTGKQLGTRKAEVSQVFVHPEQTTELGICNILYYKFRRFATKCWQVCRYVPCKQIFQEIEIFFDSYLTKKNPNKLHKRPQSQQMFEPAAEINIASLGP